MGVTTLALGILLFLLRKRLLLLTGRIVSHTAGASLSAIFQKTIRMLARASAGFVHRVQHGYTRLYLMTIFLFVSFFFLILILNSETALFEATPKGFSFFAAGVMLLMVISAVATAATGRKLGAIITLGVTGYGLTAVYFTYSAVDLAITQLLIETLTLVIFVLVVYKLPQFEKYSSRRVRIRDAVIALLAGGSITGMILLSLAENENSQFKVSQLLAGKSFLEAHGRNIVNVILMDFRSLDTLGEITVVLLSALGIAALLVKSKNNE